MNHRTPNWLLTISILLAFATPLFAQLPVAHLDAHYPLGGKRGSTFDVHVVGKHLDGAERLHFSHPGITAVQKIGQPENQFLKGPRPLTGKFVVTIKPDVPIGVYEMRAVGRFGVSGPRAFMVGDLTEVLETDENHSLKTAQEVPLESTVNGQGSPGRGDYFKFMGKRGQRVILDCWSYRLDAVLDAVLVVFDTGGNELDSNRAANRTDPLVDFTVPADGEYVVRVYDLAYRTGGYRMAYRLSISTRPYIDFIFPPAGLAGKSGKYTVYGRNLPGGKPAPGVIVHYKTLQQMSVNIALPAEPYWNRPLVWDNLITQRERVPSGIKYRVNGSAGQSNEYTIGVASAPVLLEAEPNNSAKPQPIQVPCEIAGQFWPRDDSDWFSFEAKKDDVLWIDVASQRLGLPTDPYVVIQYDSVKYADANDKQGTPTVVTINTEGRNQTNSVNNRITIGGKSFHTANRDLTYRFTAPQDGKYRMLVRDLFNSGDPRNVYRMAIRHAAPDFHLIALPMFPSAKVDSQDKTTTNKSYSVLLRKGGSEAIEVLAFKRDGFNGDIHLTVEGLPPGVSHAPTSLGPARTSVPIVLSAATNAAGWVGDVRIIGRARIDGREIVRQAIPASIIWETSNPQPSHHPQPHCRMTRNFTLAVSEFESLPVHVQAGAASVPEQPRGGKFQIPIKVTRRDGFNSPLVLKPFGLPAGIKAADVTVAAGASDAKIEFTAPGNGPVGTYSFHFRAQNLPIPVAGNPNALKAAQEDESQITEAVENVKKSIVDANQAKADADKAAAAAKVKLDEATAAKAGADAASAALKTAQEKQAAAAKRVTDLNELLTKAEKAKIDATKQTANANKAAAGRNINVFLPSTVATFKITPGPVAIVDSKPNGKLPRVGTVEVPVTIKRLYNYKGPVQLSVRTPPQLRNVSAPQVTIPAGQNAGKLELKANVNADLGIFQITINATSNLNGQSVTVSRSVNLTVEEKAPGQK